MALIERFWSKVNKRGPNECWEWIAGANKAGYGSFRVEGKLEIASRVAFFLTHGRWPYPFCLHTCDNPPCCNPAHLFEGTNKDNQEDKCRKNRQYRAQGTLSWSSKLTDEEVIEIRDQYAKGLNTKLGLSKEFRVSRRLIRRIINREIWKHI